MSLVAFLSLALPAGGMLFAIALCVAAARGDDILRSAYMDLPPAPPDDWCPDCYGTGEDGALHPCSSCHGDGRLTSRVHRTRGECRNGLSGRTR